MGLVVSFCGCNLMAEWGLYNQALGTVVDIVFDDNKKPENRDLPANVLEDSPH